MNGTAELFDVDGQQIAVVDAPPCTPSIVHAGRAFTREGGTRYREAPAEHDHRCPSCQDVWRCDSPPGTCCANAALNGNPVRDCLPCWGAA